MDPNHAIERIEASAIIYVDIKDFTKTLDLLYDSADAEFNLKRYFHAWETFRNQLVFPGEAIFRKDYYLANRVGDAFIIFSFNPNPESWFFYITNFLKSTFYQFQYEMTQIHADLSTQLKITLCTSDVGIVPYYQTRLIPESIIRKKTIAQRDFLSSWINICARIDGLEEADRYHFLCNKPVYDRLQPFIQASIGIKSTFEDLGRMPLRGLKNPQDIYGFEKKV